MLEVVTPKLPTIVTFKLSWEILIRFFEPDTESETFEETLVKTSFSFRSFSKAAIVR